MEGVVLVVLALIAGLAVGFVRGGRLRMSALPTPRRMRLVVTALGLYTIGVISGWIWSPLLPTFTALCGFTLGYFAWVNGALPGARLVALGFTANALALLINGAVPVSEAAAVRAGITDVSTAMDGQHIPATDAWLPWLGEVIPVAFPLLPQVASPGDIAIAAGLALFAASLTSTRGAPPTVGRSRPSTQALV